MILDAAGVWETIAVQDKDEYSQGCEDTDCVDNRRV
jgi:hypothetical protein